MATTTSMNQIRQEILLVALLGSALEITSTASEALGIVIKCQKITHIDSFKRVSGTFLFFSRANEIELRKPDSTVLKERYGKLQAIFQPVFKIQTNLFNFTNRWSLLGKQKPKMT